MNKIEIAQLLIDLKCIIVSPSEPFTYASGLQGPIYCDNRKIYSHVEGRSKIAQAFTDLIKERDLSYDSIAGLATAGIGHAALIAERLKAPMIYIRSKPKGHGKGSQVEGIYEANQETILVEDLVNQGSSLSSVMEGVRSEQLVAKHCLCIVDYGMKNSKVVADQWNIEISSLTDLVTIARLCRSESYITDEEFETLIDWQKDPKLWSEKYGK